VSEYDCIIKLGKCRRCRKAPAVIIYYDVRMCRDCADKKKAALRWKEGQK